MGGFLRKLVKFFDVLLFGSTAVSSILFFLVVLLSIVSRFLLKKPILASIELSRLFFIWSCFLAAAITYHRKAHIGFTLFYDKVSPGLQKYMSFIIYSFIIVFCSAVFVHSLSIIILLWHTRFPMLGISQSWLYLPVPVVCFFMIVFTIEFWLETNTKESR